MKSVKRTAALTDYDGYVKLKNKLDSRMDLLNESRGIVGNVKLIQR